MSSQVVHHTHIRRQAPLSLVVRRIYENCFGILRMSRVVEYSNYGRSSSKLKNYVPIQSKLSACPSDTCTGQVPGVKSFLHTHRITTAEDLRALVRFSVEHGTGSCSDEELSTLCQQVWQTAVQKTTIQSLLAARNASCSYNMTVASVLEG